ncbi:MAG TPA: RNA-binding protein [Bryobacteraceae bacterium]|nr:RNA-binding protein [Bryobacteraceae bacterium]
MSFTVFLGNLPVWVTADDIKSWLSSESLVADAVKVIRNPETQESKGFAFIESPNQEEMNSIIRRFDRAPLEDRLLRANPAQPPKSGKGPVKSAAPTERPRRTFNNAAGSNGPAANASGAAAGATGAATNGSSMVVTPAGATVQARRTTNVRRTNNSSGRQSAFAEELAKVL